jgi:hypothetical protein
MVVTLGLVVAGSVLVGVTRVDDPSAGSRPATSVRARAGGDSIGVRVDLAELAPVSGSRSGSAPDTDVDLRLVTRLGSTRFGFYQPIPVEWVLQNVGGPINRRSSAVPVDFELRDAAGNVVLGTPRGCLVEGWPPAPMVPPVPFPSGETVRTGTNLRVEWNRPGPGAYTLEARVVYSGQTVVARPLTFTVDPAL